MRQIDKLLHQYGESHQNSTNVWIHGIAVPSIFFVTIGLIYAIPVPDMLAKFNVTFAHILAIPMLMYYFKLSGPIGAAMTLLTIGVFLGITALEQAGISIWQFSIALFVIMWVLVCLDFLIWVVLFILRRSLSVIKLKEKNRHFLKMCVFY